MYISSFAHLPVFSIMVPRSRKLADQLHSNAVMLQRGSDGRDWFHLPKPQEWRNSWIFDDFHHFFSSHTEDGRQCLIKRGGALIERCCDMCCFRLLFWKSRAYWRQFCRLWGPVFVLFYLSLSKGVGVSVPLIYLRRGVRIDAYNTSGRFNFRWVVSCSFLYFHRGSYLFWLVASKKKHQCQILALSPP